MTRETAHAFELFTLKSLEDKLFRLFCGRDASAKSVNFNQSILCLKFCLALSPSLFPVLPTQVAASGRLLSTLCCSLIIGLNMPA